MGEESDDDADAGYFRLGDHYDNNGGGMVLQVVSCAVKKYHEVEVMPMATRKTLGSSSGGD